MIVKMHARGKGGGSGPVEYLLGKEHDRAGATLDRGDPELIEALINSSPYEKKYTSGVLSFAEADLDRATKDKIMSSFEKALLPGLEKNQYSCLWVEHKDKARLELNFVVPNIELQTGKRLQPYYHQADKPRINAWKVVINSSLNLHDPDHPKNKRELVTPRDLPPQKQAVCEAITDGLLNLMDTGKVKNRQDIKAVLEAQGFYIARETKKSISIADPEGGRNIRLKGQIYEQDFRFSEKFRGDIEAASERYESEIKGRIQQARSVYRRGIEIKRAENEKRHPRTAAEINQINIKNVVMDTPHVRESTGDELGHYSLSRELDKRKSSRDSSTKKDLTNIETARRENTDRSVWERKDALREDRSRRRSIREKQNISVDDTRGLLNDRTRKTTVERIRHITERARTATSRLSERVQTIGRHVFNYIEREQISERPSHTLERSSVELERATNEEKVRHRQQERGLAR